jgi:hypothetical protein
MPGLELTVDPPAHHRPVDGVPHLGSYERAKLRLVISTLEETE